MDDKTQPDVAPTHADDSNTVSSTANPSTLVRANGPVIPDTTGASILPNTGPGSLACDEDEMELDVHSNLTSTPVRAADKVVTPGSLARDEVEMELDVHPNFTSTPVRAADKVVTPSSPASGLLRR